MVNQDEVRIHDLMLKVDMMGTLTHQNRKAMDEAAARKDYDAYDRITKTPFDERPFFLTGDISLPVLSIKNERDQKRKGMLTLVFQSPALVTARYILYEIEPKGNWWSFVFDPMNHKHEGFFEISALELGDPDRFGEWESEKFMQYAVEKIWPRITLTTFTVKDRGIYGDEQRRHKELVDKLDNIKQEIISEMDTRIQARIGEPSFKQELVDLMLKTHAASKEEQRKKTPAVE